MATLGATGMDVASDCADSKAPVGGGSPARKVPGIRRIPNPDETIDPVRLVRRKLLQCATQGREIVAEYFAADVFVAFAKFGLSDQALSFVHADPSAQVVELLDYVSRLADEIRACAFLGRKRFSCSDFPGRQR